MKSSSSGFSGAVYPRSTCAAQPQPLPAHAREPRCSGGTSLRTPGREGPFAQARARLQAVVAVPEELRAPLLQGAHRAGQVPERGRAVEVQLRRGVVGQHPGHHRVLVEVAVGAPRQQVELRAQACIRGTDAMS